MRHRLANKSLSRPTAHRMLMLRNLVSSLLEHQRISTTLAKAKEARKLADQVIAWGKKGGKSNWDRANSFLLNPTKTLRPLFSTYATRYADRPGGFTRVLRAGFRKGDHAPIAVLELVDSPHDVKYDAAARAVGRELAVRAANGDPSVWWEFRKSVEGGEESEVLARLSDADELAELTRQNVVKTLRYRSATVAPLVSALDAEQSSAGEADDADESALVNMILPTTAFLNLAHDHYLRALANMRLSTVPGPDPTRPYKQLSQRLTPSPEKGPPMLVNTVPRAGRSFKAGERTEGWAGSDSSDRDGSAAGPIGRSKGSRSRDARRLAPTSRIEPVVQLS